MSERQSAIGVWTGEDNSTAQFSRILAGSGYAVVTAPPAAESWAAVDMLFVDADTAARYAPVIEALKRGNAGLFLPTVVVLPAGADSAPWLDAGFDDVVRLPASRSEVLARLRVLLRLRAQSLRAEHVGSTRSHMIVESAIDAVAAVDHHGRIVDFNPAARSMFGYSREAVLGKPFTLLVPPALRARYAESFSRYVVTGRSRIPGRRTELRALRADGAGFPAELSLTRIEGHAAPTFFAFVRDLSEQKRAERDLAHLAAIVESSEEAIIGQALDGTIASWNKGAERLFGYTAEEAIGRPMDMLDPSERSVGRAPLRDEARRGERHVDLDAVRVRKDGSLAEVAIRVSPILARDGTVIGASTIAYDIAARRRERMALRASEQRYRSLVAATTSVVWTSDGEGRFVFPQPSWEAFTGQPWPKHQGWAWAATLHADDRLGVSQRWAAAIAARRIFEEPCRLWHAPTGAFRHVIMRAVPIRHGDGSVHECIGTITDVDDTKRAEEAIRALNQELEQRVAARTADLAQANRELEAFSYSVSHDLRAPLRAIGGFTEILSDAYSALLDEEGRRLMQRIITNVGRMDSLVTDLLTFSRMSRVPVSKRDVVPESIVRDVVEDLLAEHGDRRFDIRIGRLPLCSADPSLLRQVYVNLLSNAFKYTSGRDPAVIEIDSMGGEDDRQPLIYVVRDNGVGFDMRFAGKLFQVFERLHNRHDVEGTGVGLALVRRIIERHGGRVWAHGAPGDGASFFFALPPRSSDMRAPAMQSFA